MCLAVVNGLMSVPITNLSKLWVGQPPCCHLSGVRRIPGCFREALCTQQQQQQQGCCQWRSFLISTSRLDSQSLGAVTVCCHSPSRSGPLTYAACCLLPCKCIGTSFILLIGQVSRFGAVMQIRWFENKRELRKLPKMEALPPLSHCYIPLSVPLFLGLRVLTALHGIQTRSCDEISVRLSVCPSVRPSVKHVHCDKTEEKSVQILIPCDR